jgi:hypothetical protein
LSRLAIRRIFVLVVIGIVLPSVLGVTAMRAIRDVVGNGPWLVVALVLSCRGTPAHADLTTYPDSASWNGAVPGTITVTIPDPAPDLFAYFGTGTASVSYGGVTFSTDGGISDSAFYNIGALFSGLPAVLSSQGASAGPENILVTFPVPVVGFALNYGTFDGSDVTFTLSNGDTFTQGSASGSSYEVPAFAGATDLVTPFSSVLITSDDFALDINNVSYAAAPGVTSVPEPGGLPLCVMGVTAFIARGLIRNARNRRPQMPSKGDGSHNRRQ